MKHGANVVQHPCEPIPVFLKSNRCGYSVVRNRVGTGLVRQTLYHPSEATTPVTHKLHTCKEVALDNVPTACKPAWILASSDHPSQILGVQSQIL